MTRDEDLLGDLSEAADPEFLTIEQVCDRYQLRREWIMGRVNAGEFPEAFRPGGVHCRLVRFRARDVQAWEDGLWDGKGDRDRRRQARRAVLRQPASLREEYRNQNRGRRSISPPAKPARSSRAAGSGGSRGS